MFWNLGQVCLKMQWFSWLIVFQYFCIKGTLKQFKDNVIVEQGTCLYKSNHYPLNRRSHVLDEIFCITDIYFLYIIITTRTNWRKKAFGLCLKYLLYFIHSFWGYWALIVDFSHTVSSGHRDHHHHDHTHHVHHEKNTLGIVDGIWSWICCVLNHQSLHQQLKILKYI